MKYKTLPKTQTKEERKKEYSRATAVEMEMSKSLNASLILSDNCNSNRVSSLASSTEIKCITYRVNHNVRTSIGTIG